MDGCDGVGTDYSSFVPSRAMQKDMNYIRL